MISRKLLSDVLKEDFSSNKIEFEQSDGVASSRIVIDNWMTINIYELAHKCKEWAFKKGYCFNILDRNNGLCTITIQWGLDFDYKKEFDSKNKLSSYNEAMIFACEWIMENKCGS